MIREYAIEPKALNNWKDCRYILEKFGFVNGRLISKFPKEWVKLVYSECSELLPKEKKRTSEFLLRAKKHLIAANRNYNRNLDWLPNAEEQHETKPFHAIIATSNPNMNADVVTKDELDEEHPLLQCDGCLTIERKATQMAECVAPILTISKRIILVDRYFSKMQQRHFRPLNEFLRVIENSQANAVLQTIEYHCEETDALDNFEQAVIEHVSGSIPKGIKLAIIGWPKGSLHNRYILTNRGGVMFGTGLDDDNRGGGTRTDVVTRLDYYTFRNLWGEYADCGRAPSFEVKGIEHPDEIDVRSGTS